MRKLLNKKYKNIEIHEKAEEITQTLRKKDISNVDYIISGLPFTVLEKNIRKEILNQVYENLQDNGKFITFQYSLDLYKYLKQKYKKLEIKFVPLNIPMAFVYVATK